MINYDKIIVKIEWMEAVATGEINKRFIEQCRAKGRVSIDEALDIAQSIGLFDDINIREAIERDKKQQIRFLLSHVYDAGERAIRSVRLERGRVYIDLYNAANITELNLLIRAENQRIQKSKRIISSLKRVKTMIQGQITLEDFYGDAL